MKKTEFNEFADFVMDEATKYGRSITKPEIETYFENFPTASLRDFKAAWVEHKRDPRHGRFFPKITDLQRALRTGNEGDVGRHDMRCTWNGNGERCKYPVGAFDLGKSSGYCLFHRSMMSGPGAQAICDESQSASPQDYLARAKRFVYGTQDPPVVRRLREQIAKRAAGGNVGILTSRLMAQLPNREADPADEHVAAADAARLAELNAELAIAAQAGGE